MNLGVQVIDEPIEPGQYRYLATRAWWMASFGSRRRSYAYLAEHLMREWIPADARDDWLLERENTGRRQWVLGTAEQAIADGFEVVDSWPTGRWRAPYGNYYARDQHSTTDAEPGWWQLPTADFLAGLPRDPERLLQRLKADGREDRPGYTGALVYALDALRTGLIPADLRAALYQALLKLPGMAAVDGATNLDGSAAVALVHNDGTLRTEAFIDPTNGHFIGERDTVTGRGHLPSGTVTASTAVHRVTVDTVGARPASG